MKVRPKICDVVDEAQRQELSTAEYPFVGPSPPPRDDESHGKGEEVAKRVIVFVAGGICRTEISALQAMEKEQNVSELHNFLIGSTDVFTSAQFLRVLADADSYRGIVDPEDVRIEEEGNNDDVSA